MKDLFYMIGRLCCMFVFLLACTVALAEDEKGGNGGKDWAAVLRDGSLWEMMPGDTHGVEPIADYGLLCDEPITFDGIMFGSRSLWFWERPNEKTRIDKRLSSPLTLADQAHAGKLMRISTIFLDKTLTAKSALTHISNAVGVAPQKRKPRKTVLNDIAKTWVFELPDKGGAIMLEELQPKTQPNVFEDETPPRLRLTLARNVESLYYARTDTDHIATAKELQSRVHHDEEGYVWLDGMGIWGFARSQCVIGAWYGLFSHDYYDHELGSFTSGKNDYFFLERGGQRARTRCIGYGYSERTNRMKDPQTIEEMEENFKRESTTYKNAWWAYITKWLDSGIILRPWYEFDSTSLTNRWNSSYFKWQPSNSASLIKYYPGANPGQQLCIKARVRKTTYASDKLIIGYNRKKETLLMTDYKYPYYCEAPAANIFYMTDGFFYYNPRTVKPKHGVKKKKSDSK